MSDTAKRDAVLKEFDTGVLDDTADNLADEIVCLRSANKDLIDHYEDARAEIDRLRARCRQIDDEAYDYAEQIEQLKAAAKDSADHYADARAEIDRLRVAFKIERANTLRLERILAALREPSGRVIEWEDPAFPLTVADQEILAAVKAAEQEVGHE